MIAIITIILISAAIAVPLIVFKNKIKVSLVVKIMAVTLFLLAVLRVYLNDNFLWVINGGTYGGVDYDAHDYLQSILRWVMTLSFVIYPCAAFFDVKTFKNIAVYFCLPASIVSLFFYNDFLNYFLTDAGRAFFVAAWFRHIEFSLEMIILITLPVLLRFALGHKFDVKNKEEWKHFCIFLPLSLIVCVPVYLTQSLFGDFGLKMTMLSLPHILWIVTIFVMLIAICFIFRRASKETKYAVCVFLALYLFYHYNSLYLMGLNMRRMPLQLCNFASYFILIALLVNKRALYDFSIVANVPGALIAIIASDVTEDILSFWNIHYYIEHTWVFIIPLLIAIWRISERPDKLAIKHFFIGLTIYYVVCASIGVVYNAFFYQPGHAFFNEANYFYLFNDTVVKILPFLGFSREVSFAINGYTFYPVYMVLVYVLFSAVCTGFVGLYKLGSLIWRKCRKAKAV